jgi:mono/diheme cytochrome c family protein
MSATTTSVLLARWLVAVCAIWAASFAAWGGDGEIGGATAPLQIKEGYRRVNGACVHCHGPDGAGSTFAPSLVSRPMAPELFRSVVLMGTTNGAGVMRGFSGDPNVAPYIDAMFAYLEARRKGVVRRGRPSE